MSLKYKLTSGWKPDLRNVILFIKERTPEEGTFALLRYGVDDEEVSGRDFASDHTAEEAMHLRAFLRTSALVIQFCRRIQNKFSHGDVEGAVKAGKALSHLLTRSSEELTGEIQNVKGMNEKRYGKKLYL